MNDVLKTLMTQGESVRIREGLLRIDDRGPAGAAEHVRHGGHRLLLQVRDSTNRHDLAARESHTVVRSLAAASGRRGMVSRVESSRGNRT